METHSWIEFWNTILLEQTLRRIILWISPSYLKVNPRYTSFFFENSWCQQLQPSFWSYVFVKTHQILMYLTNWNIRNYTNKSNQPSVAYHIETSHFICTTNQMSGFYMKCNPGVKWVYQLRDHPFRTLG